MTNLTIPSKNVRVPEQARQAVDNHEDVLVVSRGRARFVLLNAEDYALVSPILEKHRQGQPSPVEALLTADDLAILAEETDEADLLAEGMLESWS